MEGQTYVHKSHVLIAFGVGMFHHIPYHDDVGVQGVEGFASEGRIPQVGVALTVNAGGTGYHLFMIFGNKQIAVAVVHHLTEEDIVGDIALGFQNVVLAQQLGESLKIVLVANNLGMHAALVGVVDTLLQFWGDALFGCMAVQRVVYRHPVNGIVAILA